MSDASLPVEPGESAEPIQDDAVAVLAPGELQAPELDPPGKKESTPLRTCLATRAVLPRERLLRLVKDPTGALMEDLTGRLPGRGVYIRPQPAALRLLLKRRGLVERSLGSVSQWPDEEAWLKRIGEGLTRRLVEGLGLARRAGSIRFGVMEVEQALGRGERLLMALARDTAHHSWEKVERLARRRPSSAGLVEVLDRERLGAACGGSPAAALGVAGQAFIHRVGVDAARWGDFFAFDGRESPRSTAAPGRDVGRQDQGGDDPS
ncbi:MAG: DUF448 domain-containing protein [Magnetococcales bacterium]|nr:DUF448 domain-containing protein [Magnetococcales bacterium]